MSECARAVALIEDAVHGRLDEESTRFLSAHVERCAPCGLAYRRLDRQRAIVAGFAHRPGAPPELRAAVSHALARPQRRQAWLRHALVGTIAAGVVITLAFSFGLVSWRADAFEVLAREVVDDHIRVVLRAQSGARGPTDAGEILAAMQPLVDYPVPRPAPGSEQLRLSGGRPSYLQGQAVACFYYGGAGAYASLFVVPVGRLREAAARFSSSPALQERAEHRIAFWRQGAYAYVLVSEAPTDVVMPLVSLLRTS